jgi:hypothetical protein
MKQSEKTSDAFLDYVKEVNEFNRLLAKERSYRTPGIFNKLWFGILLNIPERLKPIKIEL